MYANGNVYKEAGKAVAYSVAMSSQSNINAMVKNRWLLQVLKWQFKTHSFNPMF